MTVVNTETGEIVELLDRAEAERLTTRIRLRLDTIADNYVAVMPLIREAIERQAYAALGYSGVSQYVAECFGDALAHLGVEVRREVVRELTAAGMSTRAIAPVVGVSDRQVRYDVQQVGKTSHPQTPEPVAETGATAGDDPASGRGNVVGEAVTDYPEAPAQVRDPAPVTGIDGKTYTRPARSAPKRTPLTDTARNAGIDLRKAVDRLDRIAEDDRLGTNKEQVAAHLRHHLAHAIEVCQDLLDRINN